jgi:hypothetical protein
MKYIPNTTNYKSPSNAVLPRRLDPIHHFKIVQKLGYPPGVGCWCGTSLAFAVKEPWQSREKKRKKFFDQHDQCEAKEKENG